MSYIGHACDGELIQAVGWLRGVSRNEINPCRLGVNSIQTIDLVNQIKFNLSRDGAFYGQFDLTDEEWLTIGPLLPKQGRGPKCKGD